jgi:hypothetical protein
VIPHFTGRPQAGPGERIVQYSIDHLTVAERFIGCAFLDEQRARRSHTTPANIIGDRRINVRRHRYRWGFLIISLLILEHGILEHGSGAPDGQCARHTALLSRYLDFLHELCRRAV